ncbi:helix-turn-helix domain-containing protein [Embleya scabrispora]|uniref:helix-turn-helix domain-containing protein n=1 Tax=Embleya scabrispora TaxID=159449 RepID=UPI00035E9103|nr:helix-turn-helix domain-containing protein [Embleya scabrispora]MYS80939.1 helix-turn-helix domain-containing protein [Streptomyces sp. SID5474]
MATEDEQDRRRGLGGFQRAHRELLAPEDVGLPRSPRRRTPGLRREEVAALSGVGVAWYTWLEQGRVDTSRQVLESVARALRLDADARRHVLELAGFHVPADSGPAPADALRAMVESRPTSPALVLDRALDVLAWNDAWRAVRPDPAAVPIARRNLLLMLLTDPAHEAGFPEREAIALDLVRHLRTRPDDARGRTVATQLLVERPDLSAWWRCRAVGVFAARTVRIRETATGPVAAPAGADRAAEGYATGGVALRFTMSLLLPAEAPETTVLLWTPADAVTAAHMVNRTTGAHSTAERPAASRSRSPCPSRG